MQHRAGPFADRRPSQAGDVKAQKPLPEGPTARFVEASTGQPVRLAFVAEGGSQVPDDAVMSEFTAAAGV